MLIAIEKTAEQLGRLTVRTRETVLLEADAVQPFPSPYEITLPEGVDEDDVEISFTGLTNGNVPAGDLKVLKPFAAKKPQWDELSEEAKAEALIKSMVELRMNQSPGELGLFTLDEVAKLREAGRIASDELGEYLLPEPPVTIGVDVTNEGVTGSSDIVTVDVEVEPSQAPEPAAEPATGGLIPAGGDYIPAATEPKYAPPKYTPPKGKK